MACDVPDISGKASPLSLRSALFLMEIYAAHAAKKPDDCRFNPAARPNVREK
jgi:hypothetical protein